MSLALHHLDGLHSELAAAVSQDSNHGTCIDHPLVRLRLNTPFPLSPSYVDKGLNCWADLANANLEHKKHLIQEAIISRDWHTYIFAHERPYRLSAVSLIIGAGYVGLDHLWPLISDVWSDSENIWQHTDKWLDLWRQPSRRKRFVMSKDERAFWKALPAEFTIFRGVDIGDENEAEEYIRNGMSWTLDREKAIWFAKRKNGTGFIGRAEIRKRSCFAYLSGRNEREIVIDPDKLIEFDMEAA